jgi:filamentous hemagglutinin
VQSLQAAVAAGKTLTEAIGDAFDKMFASGNLSEPDHLAVAKVLSRISDPKVQKATSFGRSGQAFDVGKYEVLPRKND